MTYHLKWNGDDWFKKFQQERTKRLTRAAIYVAREAKQMVSVAVDKRKLPPGRDGNGRFTKGRVMIIRSKPGEPPRKEFGYLRASIAWEVDANKGRARVGTNLVYGKILELGSRRMAARPWLRPALMKSKQAIKKILAS